MFFEQFQNQICSSLSWSVNHIEMEYSMATTRKNWHAAHAAGRTFGQRVADAVAATMGSWTFIIIQSAVLAIWIVINVLAWVDRGRAADRGSSKTPGVD
jgi:uncharacterized membrane protein